ncbi:ABC transporter permease subunit [Actinoplanes sp. NPDC051494]|uniref:ABC transporter permease subunit n=1 Tax=Actinoplanes sp. NPDC051494 TaxID=3363907 RepID=UPI0037B1AC29
MNHVQEGLAWLNDPDNWTTRGGLLDRLQEHVMISLWALLLGCAIGWPLGIWLGHRGRGGGAAVTIANLTPALPALALLTILPLTPLGFGQPAVVLALAVLAVPPLLANACDGLRRIDPETREAARGMGLSAGQVLRQVELPLAVPSLAAGLRTAAVQVVAVTALAAFAGGGGLGQLISSGLGIGINRGGGGQIVAGGIAVAALALLVEALLALLQWLVTPRALRTRRRPLPVATAA